MKKFLSLFLTLTLIFSSANMFVFADDEVSSSKPSAEITENSREIGDYSDADENTDSKDGKGASLFASIYDGGTGTAESPYLISTPEQLEYFAQCINGGTRTDCAYKLTKDIDLGGAEWTPIGFYTLKDEYLCTFQGIFDGDGYTISNFKITKPSRKYIGFFGFVYNGVIKNLNISNFDIDVNLNDYIYAGGIVGRCMAIEKGNTSVIENCHASGSISATSKICSVYVGGLAGYLMSSKSAEAQMTGCSAKCTVKASTKASDSVFNIYAGGLCGYAAASDEGTSQTKISNCNASGNVSSTGDSTTQSRAFAGGLCGFIGCAAKNAEVKNSFATGNTSAIGTIEAYAGGFSGYLSGSLGTASISDSYATGTSYTLVYGTDSENNYACTGSFIGMTANADKTSADVYIKDCYGTGAVTDTDSLSSYVGAFSGYNIDIKYQNCYGFSDTKLTGKEIKDTEFSLLDNEQSQKSESYDGFDFENVWEISKTDNYDYPTLKDNNHVFKTCYIAYISNDILFDEDTCSSSDTITKTKLTPSKSSDVFNDYSFSHWSESPDGAEFDFENTKITEDITLYAVFTSIPRKYVISYMNGSTEYDAYEASYGEKLPAPNAEPTLPSDSNYKYKFLYWSLSENGEEYDMSGTVSSDITLYAVFAKIGLDVWDGHTADTFTSGNGTESNPYKIRSVFQLAYMSDMVNSGEGNYASAYYSLETDLDLGLYEWTPIGTAEHPFTGTFKGNGYTIASYKVTKGNYAGLFGYTSKAKLDGFTVDGYNISLNENSSSKVYAAAVAGYASSDGGVTEISRVSAANGNINVSSQNSAIYAGNITGYLNGKSGRAYITNCYSIGDVTASTEVSEAFAGGITGYSYTGPSSQSLIRFSYSLSNCNATAKSLAYAGGIAGGTFSEGSNYSGWIPLGNSDAGKLMNDDVDTLIYGCFATGDIYATAVGKVCAGHIMGYKNENATAEKSYYSTSQAIISTVSGVVGESNTLGTASAIKNFNDIVFLSSNLGFDFSSVWSFSGNYYYPVLIIAQEQKPTFSVSNINYASGKLTANVNVLAPASSYFVSISVYNSAGRMIGFTRTKVTSEKQLETIPFTVNSVEGAVRLKVSVTDSATLQPLFGAIERTLE